LDIHTELNGSHEILELKNDIHDPAEINDWWKTQDGVTSSSVMRYRNLTGVIYQGNNIRVGLDMADASGYSRTLDKLLFASGTEREQPAEGTIWIPTSLAYSNNISVGDVLTFSDGNEAFDMKVSGVVIDLPYCAPFATSARIWMNENDYNQYFYNSEDYYMMSLRFDDYSKSRRYWDAFENDLGTPYLESVRNFESLSSFYMFFNKMIGFVMIFLAIAMMIIAIASIGFTISDDVISNYRVFGIVKSLGMTSANSISIYVMQYAFLASLSVALGIVFSYFLSGVIINSSLSFLKMEGAAVSFHFGYIACGVFFLLMILILAFVFLFSLKTRKIIPVQAIRYGTSEANNCRAAAKRKNRIGNEIASFEHLPVTLAIGLRSMLKNIRANIFTIVISALMASVLAFCFTFMNSFVKIEQTMAMWGYDSSDITVQAENLTDESFTEMLNALAEDKRVQNYHLLSDMNAVIPSDRRENTGKVLADSMSVWLTVVDGSYDDIGFTNLKGRDPVSDDEISIGVNLAKKYNKKIGDTFDVYIQGERCSFVVTGIYQAISNMAYSGRVCIEAIRNINPRYEIKDITFINVQEHVSSEELVNEINSRYSGNISASTREELVGGVFSAVVLMLIVPMLILGLAFTGLALIIIYCSCHISIKKEIKTYGIYKSVGMRSSSIRFSVLSGVLILELIGAVIGSIIGIALLPKLLNIVLSNYGIVEMPLVVNYVGMSLVVVVGVILASLGSWFASKTVQKTSPRILTAE